MANVYTYWEGDMPFVNQLCLASVRHVFGTRHHHITPDNLADYIDVDELPDNFWELEHIPYRVAIIIAMLLHHYAGWYMDCDIILKKDPTALVEGGDSYIWLEPHDASSEYMESKQYCSTSEHPCCAIMYIDKPEHGWMQKALQQLLALVPDDASSMEGWISTQQLIVDLIPHVDGVQLGSKLAFYNFDDYKQWVKHWNGDYNLDRFEYGVHLNTNLIRNHRCLPKGCENFAQMIFSLHSEDDVLREFPNSNLAAYLIARQHADKQE